MKMRASAAFIFGVGLAVALTLVAAVAGPLEDFHALAEEGSADAQYFLGNIYRHLGAC